MINRTRMIEMTDSGSGSTERRSREDRNRLRQELNRQAKVKEVQAALQNASAEYTPQIEEQQQTVQQAETANTTSSLMTRRSYSSDYYTSAQDRDRYKQEADAAKAELEKTITDYYNVRMDLSQQLAQNLPVDGSTDLWTLAQQDAGEDSQRARNRQMLSRMSASDPRRAALEQELADYEKNVLLAKQVALDYGIDYNDLVEYAKRQQDAEDMAAQEQQWTQATNKGGLSEIGINAATIPMNLIGGVTGTIATAAQKVRNAFSDPMDYVPVNTNSKAYLGTRMAETVRDNTAQNIQNYWSGKGMDGMGTAISGLYTVGMEAADAAAASWAGAAVAKGLVSAGKAAKAANIVSEALQTSSDVSRTFVSSKAAGRTDADAFEDALLTMAGNLGSVLPVPTGSGKRLSGIAEDALQSAAGKVVYHTADGAIHGPNSQFRQTYDSHRANGSSAAGAALRTLGGEVGDVGTDVLVSAAGRAVDAESRRQMLNESADMLRKVGNSKPVTAVKEAFNKYLQKVEANIDMDEVQRQVDEVLAKAQAKADDVNFRAGFNESPTGPRQAPPASKEDFLPELQRMELSTNTDVAEKKAQPGKKATEKQQKNQEYLAYNVLSPERRKNLIDNPENHNLSIAQLPIHSTVIKQADIGSSNPKEYREAFAKRQSLPRYVALLEKNRSEMFSLDPTDLHFNTAEMDAIESALQKKKLKNNRR